MTDLSSLPSLSSLSSVEPIETAGTIDTVETIDTIRQPKKAPRQGGPGFLDEVAFLDVIRLTPLVSIDLIVNDGKRKVLLGQRRNRPARNTWFVPGGRVTKGESLDAAFTRVVRDELGIASMQRSSSRLYGVFEHCYEDNFAGVPGISTHYIVLAYSITLNGSVPIGRFDQHSGYQWLMPAEVLARDDVHRNAKAYFR